MNIRSARWLALLLLLLTAILVAFGTAVGSSGLESLHRLWFDADADPAARAMAQQIVLEIRLPRTLGAWMAGALLGLAGAVAQGLFRNPLADPYLLGSASGASLGVALALAGAGTLGAALSGAGLANVGIGASSGMGAGTPITLFSGQLMVRLGLTGTAFVGAMLAVLMTLALARGVGHTLRLLLSGVIVGVVLGALTSLVLLLSPDSMQAMQAFLLGTTSFVGWTSWGLMTGMWLACAAITWLLARVLDGLSLGETTAQSLGLPLAPMRATLLAVLALCTATAVAQTGLIAFVGLAAPHLVRTIVKVAHRYSVLLASLMGGVLLATADILSRWLIAPQELPVGVVTAALGGGYLLWLMQRRGSGLQRSLS